MTKYGCITTGLDIADETRAFNTGIAELLMRGVYLHIHGGGWASGRGRSPARS
jgi:acetyl esterase/lipase